MDLGQKIVYVYCEAEEKDGPWGRPSLIVIEWPMEPFTHTPAVRFAKQEDSQTVMRRSSPIFYIFIRSPVLQTRSYARIKSKKVAMVHRRRDDWNP